MHERGERSGTLPAVVEEKGGSRPDRYSRFVLVASLSLSSPPLRDEYMQREGKSMATGPLSVVWDSEFWGADTYFWYVACSPHSACCALVSSPLASIKSAC